MTIPMIGTWAVDILAVRPFAIHGDLYYELQARHQGETEEMFIVRVPQHAVKEEPQAGDRLELSFLMGQVTEARRI